MKRVLIIDEYEPLRTYLSNKLASYKLEIITARNGLEGMSKLRENDPDLVITDYYLSRKTINDILAEKEANPNISSIPVIILSSELSKQNIALLGKHHIKKILNKPLKIDLLFKAIASILDIDLPIDSTPGILEAHFNSEILFIEIAGGLNKEKIELLQYKIIELMELYKVAAPKVLILMSDISVNTISAEKLELLLAIIINQTKSALESIKLLTSSEIVLEMLEKKAAYKAIEVMDNLEKAMNSLMGIKITDFLDEGKNIIKKDFLTKVDAIHSSAENIQLKFSGENKIIDYSSLKNEITLAVVDDDVIIHSLIKTAFLDSKWNIKYYKNGREFIKEVDTCHFDLIFLDLMMPVMNGFEVMEYLKDKGIRYPVIVLSALSRIETIEKASRFGIKSYMIKPLGAENIIKKTKELLKTNF